MSVLSQTSKQPILGPKSFELQPCDPNSGYSPRGHMHEVAILGENLFCQGPGWGHSDKTNLRGKRRKPARVECAEPAFKVSEAGVGYLTASAPYMTLFDPSHISSSPHTSLSALFITSFTQIQRDPSIKSIKSSLLCLYMTLLQPSPTLSQQL